jgi:hypothetical protein
MMFDSVLAFDLALVYLYLKDCKLKLKENHHALEMEFRILILLRGIVLVASVIPMLTFFTRKTIRKIAIFRVVFDFVLFAAVAGMFYVKLIPIFYKDMNMDQKKKLSQIQYMDPTIRFWSTIAILALSLVSLIIFVCFYYKRTIKLDMVKEGGLSVVERGLALGMAAEGRSRTSTEINMGMKSSKEALSSI